MWCLLTGPAGRPGREGAPGRDLRQAQAVITLMAVVALPCCIASLALVLLFASDPARGLLTASTWLNRAAQGCAVIVWAAIARLWWRDKRRRRRGRGCR
jgi:hypothetical protein